MTKKENQRNRFFVITQCFYGNRTGTDVEREHIDHVLRGYLGLYESANVADVVRKAIHVPGSDNIVIVYDQTQEDHYVNVEFPEIYAREGVDYLDHWGEELKMQVSCEIPELNITLHTRCFACRMDENGELQSIEEDDVEKFIHFFPAR